MARQTDEDHIKVPQPGMQLGRTRQADMGYIRLGLGSAACHLLQIIFIFPPTNIIIFARHEKVNWDSIKLRILPPPRRP